MVRKAVMDDFPVILNIYATARAFMAKTGNPTQWADGHPSADLLRECIFAQKLFVFTDPDDFSQIHGCSFCLRFRIPPFSFFSVFQSVHFSLYMDFSWLILWARSTMS